MNMENSVPVVKPLQPKPRCYLVFFYNPKTGEYFTKIYNRESSMIRAKRNWWYLKSYSIEEWRDPIIVKNNNLDKYPIEHLVKTKKNKDLPF